MKMYYDLQNFYLIACSQKVLLIKTFLAVVFDSFIPSAYVEKLGILSQDW